MIKRIQAAQYPMSGPFWDSISTDAKDLVKKLLVAKAEDRLGVDGVLQHESTRRFFGSGAAVRGFQLGCPLETAPRARAARAMLTARW